MTDTLTSTDLPLPNRRQGKVRDIYDCTLTDGREALLIIASDRISAYDVVMPTPIPGKGKLLTEIASFWFKLIEQSAGNLPRHHLISTDPRNVAGLTQEQQQALTGRVMVGQKADVIPIECVVRGYLAGSGWVEYQQSQSVCGEQLPAGLKQCSQLPQPIFTPATKAETGHDENISFAQACDIVGQDTMTQLRQWSLAIYQLGHAHAAARGIILADTKFEFGRLPDGQLILIDEVMTPDSSRFWPADQYRPGQDQPSFDKQFVRNYLTELVEADKWQKQPPGPKLPDSVVQGTLQRYREARDKLFA